MSQLSEASVECIFEGGDHSFIVVDWAFEPAGPSNANCHPHTKQARRLLCQRCFVEYDLGMIARARTNLLNT